MPLLQVKVVEPVLGTMLSTTEAEVAPLFSSAANEPLQVFPPTVQVTAPEQLDTQVAPDTTLLTPLLQVNLAEPVVGLAVSEMTGDVAPLLMVPVNAPLQVLAPTVQLTAPEQPASHVAPAF